MSLPAAQRNVAAFLAELAGGPPIETHISAVFVGRDEVWKLKKAVRLTFLDFSSIEARHHFLCRELALNKPDAPELYRDVVAIETGADGKLAIGRSDSNSAVDWVLRMAPIDAADFLDRLAGRGELTVDLQDALGDCVARYHHHRPPLRDWDSPGALRGAVHGNAEAAVAAGLSVARIETWAAEIGAELERQAEFLARRARSGSVRRCHGDLHLGNLHLWKGKPLPFDALEFDEDLATIDVGYDLAFLLMDLDLSLSRPAANRVMNRYLARTGDAALTGGLPIFLSLRAMVRAHVLASAGKAEAAIHYLDAALAYLVPAPSLVLAIGGLPGVGKTSLARLVSPALGRAPGAVVLRSDEIRKRLFAAAPEQRLPQSAYDEATNRRVGAELAAAVGIVAARGQAVIADATFLDPDQRRAVAEAARAKSVPFLGIWLTAPRHLLETRIAQRRNDASDAHLAVLRTALDRETGRLDWQLVEAIDAEAAARKIGEAAAERSRPADRR